MSVRADLRKLWERLPPPPPPGDGRGMERLLAVLERLRIPAAAGNGYAAESVRLLDEHQAGHLDQEQLLIQLQENRQRAQEDWDARTNGWRTTEGKPS